MGIAVAEQKESGERIELVERVSAKAVSWDYK
jgi:hypothetical protein